MGKPRRFRLTLAFAVFYAAVQALLALDVLGGYTMVILNRALIFVVLATSLNLINGIAGQFSLGHMGFAAVGAYVSGAITTLVFPAPPNALAGGALFLAALLTGALAASAVGFLIGFPCLRLRGDYLAVVTLGFGEIIRTLLNGIPAVGGPRGLLGIPKYSSFTVISCSAFLTIVVLRNVIQSAHGRALLSIRENELASAMVGVATIRYKLLGFVLGAFFAGLAGGLMAHLLQMAHPTQFGFQASALLLIMVYAGGLGSLTGSILTALLFTFLTEGLRIGIDWLKDTAGLPIGTEWTMAIYALLLILIMLFRSEGLMGNREASLLAMEDQP